MVAIFILTLAITGPVYISSFALRNTIDSRDNISAQYLAEEVVEVIRNKRDTRIFQEKNWMKDDTSFITDNSYCFNVDGTSGNKCVMKIDDDNKYVFENCNGVCDNMSFSAESNVYYGKTSEATKSKFKRDFYIVSDTSDNAIPNKEAKIIVNISWNERGQNKTYSLTERLYPIDYNSYFLNDN